MKNTFGSALALTIFGESHGRAIGGVLDGMAAGVPVDEEFIAACMDKRRARGDGLSTPRVEADNVQLLSGVVNGHTTGTAIALMIENQNTAAATTPRRPTFSAPATRTIPPTPNTTAFRTPGAVDTFRAASLPRWWQAVPSCWVR